MYKVICFDLDGTLIDSIQDIANSMNLVLKEDGLKVYETKDYKEFIGNGANELVRLALNNDGYDLDYFVNKYKNVYSVKCLEETKEFPYVTNTLMNLKTKYKLALITNKPDVDAQKVVNHFFPNVFDFILGQKSNIEKKPNKEGMDLMMEYFDVDCSECLYVGDSEVDYNFAINSNTDVLILTYGYAKAGFLKTLKDKYKIDSFKEILNKI